MNSINFEKTLMFSKPMNELIAGQCKDYVYFSDNLRRYYPRIYKELDDILTKHNVCHGVLKGTADYWCRDYMPVQISDGNFVQFIYHPDYLEGLRDYETPADVSLDLAQRLTNASIRMSPVIADGGNFTFGTVKEKGEIVKVVVMTEKIFFENQDMEKESVIRHLEELFPGCRLLFLPWDKDDVCGHTDGILHAVRDNEILVNLNVYPDNIAKRMRSILESCFKVIDLELSDFHDKSWAYINMIHTRDVIILPGLGLSTDEEALNHVRRLFPEYNDRIYQVQMPSIVKKGGALNCLSWNFAGQ